MKQKIVIKVQMHCDKCRAKAMKIAAGADGVSSVAIAGKDNDQVVVTGEGIDSAKLTCLLRKKLGYATIISVGEAKGKEEGKGEAKGKEEGKEEKLEICKFTSSSYCQCQQCTLYYGVVYDPTPSICSIM